MKKILALLLSIMMVFALAACGKNNTDPTPNTENNVDTTQTPSDESSNASSATDKIVNDEGEEFTVDLSKVGEIKDGAEALSSSKFEIAGSTYTFPIKMSELFNNGWRLSKEYEYKTEFDANSYTNLGHYFLIHESGLTITLNQIINDSNEKKDIKECTLVGFHIYTFDLVSPSDYVLPGGIIPTSTAANIITVFGNPNNSGEFTGDSYNSDDHLTYSKHRTSNIDYDFSFNEDGTIYSIGFDYDDGAIYSTGFDFAV